MQDSPSPEEIADLAFQLWVNEGQPEGRAEEHWAAAERKLREQRAASENAGADATGETAAGENRASANTP